MIKFASMKLNKPGPGRQAAFTPVVGLAGALLLGGCMSNPATPATSLSALTYSHDDAWVYQSEQASVGFEGAPLVPSSLRETRAEPTIELILEKPDQWALLRANMHLDRHLDQARVQQEIRWLKNNPEYLYRLGPRLQRYLPFIYRKTRERNLPAEIALLPIVESAMNVYAFSHGGAAGPWQFLRATGRQQGLQINDWYDGRRDIVTSTDAAHDYLTYLHKRFGDWYKALAAYNAGQGNVSKSQRRSPGAGFFEMRLPRETQMYVPRLLALAEVVSKPDEYGIKLPELPVEEPFDTVSLPGQFQIDKLADALGLDTDTIYDWNPALNRWATSPRGPHHIIVPAHIETTAAALALNDIPKRQRMDWIEHKVARGDSFSAIAARYGLDVSILKSVNNKRSNLLQVGERLVIPNQSTDLKAPAGHRFRISSTYKVRAGDSLWEIAKNYGTPLRRLMTVNQIGPKDPLQIGQVLKIPGAAMSSAPEVTKKLRYKVRRGDSLSRIASKFDVTVKDITRWNDLDRGKYLQPGQGLLLFINVAGGG